MIDEKILIEKIKDHAQKVGCGNTAFDAGYQLAHEHIIDIIHLMQIKSKPKAPVIPPLRAVVLCKDCYYHNGEKKICTNASCVKSFFGCKVSDDHFCSFGQRTEDNGN